MADISSARSAGGQRPPDLPDFQFTIDELLSYNDAAARAVVSRPTLDTVTAQVAAAWEAVLGRASLDADPTFTAAGGDSLSALLLVGELERRCGIKLPLTSVGLATRRSEVGALVTGLVAGPPAAAPPSDTLVLLKPGIKSPSLFLMHGLGGHVGELADLARQLACGHPVYALQLPGLAPDDPVLDGIAAMAVRFAGPIAMTEPNGPLLLLGYSLGGLLAFETACQLQAEGRETRLLLLDCHPHPRYWPIGAWLGHLAGRTRTHAQIVWRGEAGNLLSYAARLLHRLFDRWRVWQRRLPLRVDEIAATDSAAVQRIRHGMIAAEAAYRPHRYAGSIGFIRPERGEIGAPYDPLAVWRGRVAGIDIIDVPGDHQSIVMADVASTAAAVDRWVLRAGAA